MRPTLDCLFEPLRLGQMTLPNRIVMSPMTRCRSPGGVPGDDVAAYYERRARADVGLIITEGVGVDHPAALGHGLVPDENVPTLHGEAALAGWRTVVDRVHGAGGRIIPQLWHTGPIRLQGTGPHPEAPSMRPSGVWGPAGAVVAAPEYLEQQSQPTRPMSDGEIADVIAAYARSAAHARAVGFDGIAIHGAHGYLIDSFFWTETNLRTDRWGGDLAGRGRFGVEVVKAVREAVGPDLPIVFRWSQWKQQDYAAQLATSPRDLEALLGPLAEAGVDLFDTSTRIFSAPAFEGSDLSLAGWVKKVIDKPTMAVGGVGLSKDLQSSFAGGAEAVDNLDTVAERMRRNEFDLIAVGRSLLIDPHWLHKVRAGAPFAPFDMRKYGELT